MLRSRLSEIKDIMSILRINIQDNEAITPPDMDALYNTDINLPPVNSIDVIQTDISITKPEFFTSISGKEESTRKTIFLILYFVSALSITGCILLIIKQFKNIDGYINKTVEQINHRFNVIYLMFNQNLIYETKLFEN